MVIDKNNLKKEALEYETKAELWLETKVPVFVRVDGKSFRNFTKKFQKPFDPVLTKTMQQTMKKLCEEAEGCVYAYAANDEITLVLTDYHRWNSTPWLDYRVQKVSTIAASIATIAFNKFFFENKEEFYRTYQGEDKETLYAAYNEACNKGALFDGRCFNVPEHRVCEMIYYRQLECRRNSIRSLARKYFTVKELLGRCNDEVLEMLKTQKGIDWNNTPNEYRIGSACTKGPNPFGAKKKWCIDRHMPMLCDGKEDILKKILDSVRVDE